MPQVTSALRMWHILQEVFAEPRASGVLTRRFENRDTVKPC
jgi:hypothetical protein